MMKNISKFIFILTVIIGVILFIGKQEGNFLNPFPDTYTSPYVFVLDRETGETIFQKKDQTKIYPASLTKVMTTLVALEHINDLNAIAPIDVPTYQAMVENNASMAGFVGNEQVTYRDLLYGTMLSSGGEAANTLAIHIGGSVDQFVKLMNEKAATLGLTKTHFTNAEGLHDKRQITTARDMGVLLNEALKNDNFKAIFTKSSYVSSATVDHPNGVALTSTVLSELDQHNEAEARIIGGKSGTTYEAGQCWATLGKVQDKEYIVIVMGAPLEDIHHPDQAQIEDTLQIYEQISIDAF